MISSYYFQANLRARERESVSRGFISSERFNLPSPRDAACVQSRDARKQSLVKNARSREFSGVIKIEVTRELVADYAPSFRVVRKSLLRSPSRRHARPESR